MRTSAADPFFDTNVVLCLFGAQTAKAERAEAMLAQGAMISVQVLDEVVAIARRNMHMSWNEVRDVTGQLRAACRVAPLTLQMHDEAVRVAEETGYSIHDSMIVAAALASGCSKLYSEDLQHGRTIDGRLTIMNPFV